VSGGTSLAGNMGLSMISDETLHFFQLASLALLT
jgi:hypothetical protein